MKPFSHVADFAPTKPAQDKPAQLQRQWVKVDGKLECRWVSAR
ncbi:MAG: hypothetical protein ABUS57_06655 [Pseudomonadota bacterium]